jgi:hypothetical protein
MPAHNHDQLCRTTSTETASVARLSPEWSRRNLYALILANREAVGGLTENSLRIVLKFQKDTAYEYLGSAKRH